MTHGHGIVGTYVELAERTSPVLAGSESTSKIPRKCPGFNGMHYCGQIAGRKSLVLGPARGLAGMLSPRFCSWSGAVQAQRGFCRLAENLAVMDCM